MKMRLYLFLSPALFLLVCAGCSLPGSGIEQKIDMSVPIVKAASRVYMGPYTDQSGQIQITIYDASVTGQHNTVTAYIADDEVLVGGGAYTGKKEGFLTGSYPSLNNNGEGNGWTAQSKDHFIVCSHQTTAQAVGMKLKDKSGNFIPKSTVQKYIKIFSSTNYYAQHPTAETKIPSTYSLIGGGSRVEYPFGEDGINVYGNLLTASRPNDVLNGWLSASKDHSAYSPAMLTAYAIGYKKDEAIPNFGYIYARVFPLRANVSKENTHCQLASECSFSYALIGVGGFTVYNSSGRLLNNLHLVANQYGMIGESDLIYPDTGIFAVQAIGVTQVPSLK